MMEVYLERITIEYTLLKDVILICCFDSMSARIDLMSRLVDDSRQPTLGRSRIVYMYRV
jgi:hypothetical protein